MSGRSDANPDAMLAMSLPSKSGTWARGIAHAAGLAMLVALASPCASAASDDAMSWDQLGEREQEILAPMRDNWEALDAGRQQRLLRGAQQWEKLDDRQRARVQRRMESWQHMDSQQRERVQQMFERYNELEPDRQQRLRGLYERFRRLPEDQQQSLRNQWRSMDPEQRLQLLEQQRRNRWRERNNQIFDNERFGRRPGFNGWPDDRPSVIDRMRERQQGVSPGGPQAPGGGRGAAPAGRERR
ncbi:MAG: DUF3106 domain-containing protein [Gammaproteobacteria bacterium]|nr:DUF3106 domain-containing protein [Gammaproteobacteria bacterium]